MLVVVFESKSLDCTTNLLNGRCEVCRNNWVCGKLEYS